MEFYSLTIFFIMRTIDFLASLHGVTLTRSVRHLPVLEQCKFIASRSTRLLNCEPYWLLVAALTYLKNPQTCFVAGPIQTYENVLPLVVHLDFDETTVLTEAYEGQYDWIEKTFNCIVSRPSLVQGGKVDNLGIFQEIADNLGLPVELVITFHSLEWDGKMKFRPGVIDYVRSELSSGREIRVVSSSYEEIVASRLYTQGHKVEWSREFVPYWVLPEGRVRIVGRSVDAELAKPNPHIHNTSVRLSGQPIFKHVVFEDSPSGVGGAKNAGINVRIGVGDRTLDVCHQIQDFTGFTPATLDQIWSENTSGNTAD